MTPTKQHPRRSERRPPRRITDADRGDNRTSLSPAKDRDESQPANESEES